MERPTGWLTVKWGDDVQKAAAKLKVTCRNWLAWGDGRQGFEVCAALQPPVQVYGVPADQVRLIHKDGKLVGLEAVFTHCARHVDALRAGLVREFHLDVEQGTDPYQVWHSGEVVHFRRNNPVQGSCSIAVTSATFGKAYSDSILAEGLRNFVGSMRPH